MLANRYGICRQRSVVRGKAFYAWFVSITRQGKAYQRAFAFITYGGELPALKIATAYRDALMRLIPPETTNTLHVVPTARNRSSIPGVFRAKNGSKLQWVAAVRTQERVRRKKFSIQLYGEEGAKQRAIVAHQELLKDVENRFRAQNQHALEIANASFDPAVCGKAVSIDSCDVQASLTRLNRMFDDLRPRYVRVRCAYLHTSKTQSLRISMTGACLDIAPVRKTWSIGMRDLVSAQLLAWKFIHETLVSICGQAWCDEFSRQYKGQFMAVNKERSVDIRMVYR